jgi:hypothetical protein
MQSFVQGAVCLYGPFIVRQIALGQEYKSFVEQIKFINL